MDNAGGTVEDSDDYYSSEIDDDDDDPLSGLQLDLHDRLDDFVTAGEIAWHASYSAFVDPCLTLGGSNMDIDTDTDNSNAETGGTSARTVRAGSSIPLSLPLCPDDAAIIRDACQNAPPGKSEQRYLAWDLDASQFELANPAFQAYVDTHMLAPAVKAMGLPAGTVAELRSIRLHDQDYTSEEHKDAAPALDVAGMLVVCLPSHRKGGDVIFSFRREKHTCPASKAPHAELTAFAWYSDVTHQVLELTQGHLLALMYNIVVPKIDKRAPSAASFHNRLDELTVAINQWAVEEGLRSTKNKIIYPLKQKYAGRTPSMATLKGHDATVGRTLLQLLRRGFYGTIASLTYEKNRSLYERHFPNIANCKLKYLYSLSGMMIAQDYDVEHSEISPTLFPHAKYHFGENGKESSYSNWVFVIWPFERLQTLPESAGFVHPNALLFEIGIALVYQHRLAPAAVRGVEDLMIKCCGLGYKPYSSLPRMLDLALRHGRLTLYRAGVRAGARTPFIHDKILCHMIIKDNSRLVNGGFGGPVWDQWLGVLVDTASSITTLKGTLASFASSYGRGPLGASFRRWMAAVVEHQMETLGRAGEDDSMLILDAILARQGDHEWLTTCIPNLCSRSDRQFLGRVIAMLLNEDELTPNAKELIVKLSLENGGSKLVPSYNYIAYGTPSDRAVFLSLLGRCWDLGLMDSACLLLEALRRNLQNAPIVRPYIIDRCYEACGSSPELETIRLTISICAILRRESGKCDPFSSPSCRACVEDLLECINRRVPSYPKRGYKGWAGPTVACSCKACDILNRFLSSEEKSSLRFFLGEEQSRHIDLLTMKHRHWISVKLKGRLTASGGDSGVMSAQIDKKATLFDGDVGAYKLAVAALKNRLMPLNNMSTRKLLGKNAFRRLVLLEQRPPGHETD